MVQILLWEVFAIRIAIGDDDSLCLENTRNLVSHWGDQSGVSVKTEIFENGDSLLNYCHREKTDIILLDILMPLLNGMDTAREIREFDSNVKLLFLTSSPEFAVESYDVRASGYLLKPVAYGKLEKVLNNCLQSIQKDPDTVILRTGFGYQSVHTNNVEFLEAQNKKVVFTLSDGSRRDSLDTLSFYEKKLTLEKGFFKCHRSYIVYIPAVNHFSATDIQTNSGIRIPIARGLGKAFQEAYFAYMFKE